MGLDTVELVLAIEDEFGIRINHQIAKTLRTPGDVADYVMSRVRTEINSSCLAQVGFYRVRSVLVMTFNASHSDIHPTTPLAGLLHADIKHAWPALGRALQADNFPPLVRPRRIVLAAVVAPTLITIAGMAWADIQPTIIAISAAFVALCTNSGTSTMRVVIPDNCSTVEALIPFVATTNAALWTRERVLATILQITSTQLGIPIEKIREDSTFVDELGAD
ncbi:hypothetical protein [Duganella aceris]|uniref:Carrier domain-containing protein n=1 Tax=Duganella aceris TaxID=2703883 RepID=A0ABX0FEQ2_9BURK|nr:hypothetical protein [Duganella aceris]NGZ83016.1 hypothetical protein [Duganella aceris]